MEWGPLSVGEGSALRHAFPFIETGTESKNEILIAVAGYCLMGWGGVSWVSSDFTRFVSRTCLTLFAPSVSRMPFAGRPGSSLELDFVFIAEMGVSDTKEIATPMLNLHMSESMTA